MEAILLAIQEIMTLRLILLISGGTALGITIGAMPGLSATMGLAILLPLTFPMPSLEAMLLLLGMYTGAVYGGSIAAILVNIPGAPPAVMTALDGYPMSQSGNSGKAIGFSIVSSVLGGLVGVVALILIAPWLAGFALSFGPVEYATLALFGLSTIVAVVSKSPIKGFIGVIIGLLIATVGQDPFTNVDRFTFGNIRLMIGVDYIPIVIGLFGLAEVISQMLEVEEFKRKVQNMKGQIFSYEDFKLVLSKFIPSSLIGVIIGILPGAGGTISSIIGYNASQQLSKSPETFGQGNPEGIIGAESANNAAVGASLVPLLTLGIPGSSPAAVLLGALMIHGLRPGPLLFINEPATINAMFVALIVAQITMGIIGFLGVKRLAPLILSSPQKYLLPFLVLLCMVGSYALNNSFFDMGIMIFFGVFGFLLMRFGVKAPPIILGVILGPMVENNLRTALETHGTMSVFITRPISLVMLILIILILTYPVLKRLYLSRKGTQN